VLREGETHALTLHSGLRPSEDALASNGPSSAAPDQGDAPAALGMTLAPDPKGGLVVRAIDPNSDAAAKGVRPGDVILKAGLQPLQSAADLTQAATQARQEGRKSLPLLVTRGEQHLYVPVGVGDKAG
jgi:serine protease Do